MVGITTSILRMESLKHECGAVNSGSCFGIVPSESPKPNTRQGGPETLRSALVPEVQDGVDRLEKELLKLNPQ